MANVLKRFIPRRGSITQRVIRRAQSQYGVHIIGRGEWGSREETVYKWRRKYKPVKRLKADTLVQHITVTKPSGDLKADARTVERIGMERFGSGVSYNFLVDMETGHIAVGQSLDAKGTHTVNNKNVSGFSYDQNAVARAIAVVGMPNTPLSPRAHEAIAGLIAAMIDEGALTPGFDYVPHSFFAYKDCPSDSTRSQMKAIRSRAVQRRSLAKR